MADEIIRHVNCASDFRIVFAFSSGKLPDYPWRLGLKTPNTPSYNMYVASFDGTTYNNCSPIDDESIMVFVDHHRLVPGILHYYLQTDAPDSLFPDGEMNITIPGTVNIELWDGPSDGDTPPEVTVIVERLLKGDKGDKGDTPEITADEQGNIYSDGELLTDVIANACSSFSKFAEQAEKDEQARVDAESGRKTAEYTRISNENARKEAETAREEAEKERQANTSTAIKNCENATGKANEAATAAN